MSWKAEVTTPGDGGRYNSNALRFATKQEAEDYAFDLAYRWTAVMDWRAAESDDPVTHVWIRDQGLAKVGEEDQAKFPPERVQL
jgi:hypothetical protein